MHNLKPEDHLVYCWRYSDDALAKIGVSRVDCLYGRISQAQTNDYRNVELLGIQPCDSRDNALKLERVLLDVRLKRYRSDREWVFLDRDAWQWLADDCLRDIPIKYFQTLDSDPSRKRDLQNDPESHQDRLKTRVLDILERKPRLTAREIGNLIHWANGSEVKTVISRLVETETLLVEKSLRTQRFCCPKVPSQVPSLFRHF